MAATLFFPPPSALPSSHNGGPLVPSEEDDYRSLSPLSPLRESSDDELEQSRSHSAGGSNPSQEESVEDSEGDLEEEEGVEEETVEEVDHHGEEEEQEVEESGGQGEEDADRVESVGVSVGRAPEQSPETAPMEVVETQVEVGRRVTLKPRRTLSLSPTPARTGDMMGHNLKAARWLDFTNEDDDDGLYQEASDSDSDSKKKPSILDEPFSGSSSSFGKMRTTRRGGSLTLGAMSACLSREFSPTQRGTFSVKRPLEVTLPCQEIQYLDISYQNVGIHSVQFSPIPRKKITYHPVPYHAIHYCDVPYLGERPIKRKPPA